MDINLEVTLRKRADSNQCIICGKDLTKQTSNIILDHLSLGVVEICESHIKQSGFDA